MAEPTLFELGSLLNTLTAKLDGVQAQVTGIQTKVDGIQTKVDGTQQGASSSASFGPTPGSSEHHDNWLSHFQKMDFPKFDGKSDPLVFINRCESYFH
jgi:hypothetical protein